jgi:hypothetical protein
MKKILLLVFIAGLCKSGFSQSDLLLKNKVKIEKELKYWMGNYSNFALRDFIISDTSIFDYKVFKTPPAKIDKAAIIRFETHKPILTPNAGNNLYLDIYSAQLGLEKRNGKYYSNIDDGGAVQIWDLKKNVYYRISYSATSSWVDEAIWINDKEFLLARSVTEVDDSGFVRLPEIYFGNLLTNSFLVFKNKNSGCKQKKELYRSPKLKKIPLDL